MRLPAGVDSGDGVAPELKQKGYEVQVCGCVSTHGKEQFDGPSHPPRRSCPCVECHVLMMEAVRKCGMGYCRFAANWDLPVGLPGNCWLVLEVWLLHRTA